MPSVDLYLTSTDGKTSYEAGEPFAFSVMINVSGYDIRGVEIVLKYSPSVLSVESVVAGDFLIAEEAEFFEIPVARDEIDDINGLIEFAAAKILDSPLILQEGEVLTVSGVTNQSFTTRDNIISIMSVSLGGKVGDEFTFIQDGVRVENQVREN